MTEMWKCWEIQQTLITYFDILNDSSLSMNQILDANSGFQLAYIQAFVRYTVRHNVELPHDHHLCHDLFHTYPFTTNLSLMLVLVLVLLVPFHNWFNLQKWKSACLLDPEKFTCWAQKANMLSHAIILSLLPDLKPMGTH